LDAQLPDQFVVLVLGETQLLVVVRSSESMIWKWLKQADAAASAAWRRA